MTIEFWYDRQVGSNQYGLGGRTERGWGKDSLEGVLSDAELAANRAEQPKDTAENRFLDDEYFQSRNFDLTKIEVPILSAANLGAIHLHLRGNVIGYLLAGSKFKYLRFITGRHDVPFFYDEEVEVQRSFLDACLKGDDKEGWLVPGKMAPVSLVLRKGNPGHNDPRAEREAFPRRTEMEWPIARTKYKRFHLNANGTLSSERDGESAVVRYEAPSGVVTFKTEPFKHETEITGHPKVRLSMALSARNGSTPSEMDIFVTLRHLDASGSEIYYTGAVGDPIPVVRGWLRTSLRKTTEHASLLSAMIPERDYLASDVQPVRLDEVYTMDVEIWPTNVVLQADERLALQVSSCDTENVELFSHNHSEDRAEEKLKGWNEIHVGPKHDNYLTLPVIPMLH